jgi:putative redox protein
LKRWKKASDFANTKTSLPYAILGAEVDGMSNEGPKAVVVMTGEDLFTGHSPSGHQIMIDTDRVRNSAPSPMELLLLALGSCTGVDVVSILRKKREQVTDYRVEIRGERREDYPRSYQRMTVHHIVTGRNVSERSVAQAIELSETKYCSVAATLRPTAEIVSSYEIIEGVGA